MRIRIAISLAFGTLGLSLACAAVALAVGAPTLDSPENGASFPSGSPITFSAAVSAPTPGEVDFNISRQPEIGSDGAFPQSNRIDVIPAGSSGGDPSTYTASTNSDTSWPAKPDTYFWQAIYFDCTQDPIDCVNVSETRSLKITPLPAAAVSSPNQVETFLNKRPRHRIHRRKAKFAFSSNVQGARFECLFAKGWAKCRSPHVFRHLRPGRYKFEVRAVVNGLEDPDPQAWFFRVLRHRHHHHH